MRVLLATLQVSEGGSKGHLHPALHLGRALLARGHQVGVLALPHPLSPQEREELGEMELLETPPAPCLASVSQLASLASSPETVHLAYQCFLLDPLDWQFEAVERLVGEFSPNVVLSDTLVYAAALAARRRGIVDVGFCAGLKLIAPPELTLSYQRSHQKLLPRLEGWSASFRNLELLSPHGQFVFTLPELVEDFGQPPPGTEVLGPLARAALPWSPQDYAVLCFGSVLDPARYPDLLEAAARATGKLGWKLKLASRSVVGRDHHVEVQPYLNLPDLLGGARAVIHHGGAGCFGECLAAGAPQLILPLMNDQPIQAEVLHRSGAGLRLHPEEVTPNTLQEALEKLADLSHPLHQRRQQLALRCAQCDGAARAAQRLEAFC